MTSPCDAWLELLPDRVGGQLSSAASQAFDAHVAGCDRCREAVQDWRLWRATAIEAGIETAPPGAELALARVLAAGDEARRGTFRRRRLVWPLAAALAALALGLMSIRADRAGLTPAHRSGGGLPGDRPIRVASDGGTPDRTEALPGPDALRATRLDRTSGARGADSDQRRYSPLPPRQTAGGNTAPVRVLRPPTVTARPATAPAARVAVGDGDAVAEPDPSTDRGEHRADPITAASGQPPSATETPEPEAPPPASETARPPAETPMPAPTAAARIAGRVEDLDGHGLAWALVYLRPELDEGRRFLLTDTAEDGSFELTLPAGRYRLVVEHEGFDPAWYGGAEPWILELSPEASILDLILRLSPVDTPLGPATSGGSVIAPPKPGDIGIQPPEPPQDPDLASLKPGDNPKEGKA